MVSVWDSAILEYKKALFLEEVKKASINLGVIIPNVKFWNHYEDHFNDGERAHIHLEENLICIPEPELKIMTADDIRKTATHEVSHINHIGHGWEFQKTHDELKLEAWEPPPGTIGALPEDYIHKKEKKEKKSLPIKYKCNECGKKGKTKKCRHCNNYFCLNHIKPSEPYFGNISNIRIRKDEPNTHPCLGYVYYLNKKKKKEEEEYTKALERLCKKKNKEPHEEKSKEILTENNEEEIHKESLNKFKDNKKKTIKRILNKLFNTFRY